MKDKFVKLVEGLKCVPIQTWVILISGILLIVNATLAATGINPISISNDALYQLVSNVLAISSAAYLIWKNFSVTKNAQTSDEVLSALKNGTLAIAEVVAFINESRNNTNTAEKANVKTMQNESEGE